MWIVARYIPIAPFSLKPAASTSSGGKTLLVMTPYAVKMALLDVVLRTHGLVRGEVFFPSLRDLVIAMAPPDDILVFKTFSKIWRPVEPKESKSQKVGESLEEFETRMQKMEQKQQDQMDRGQYPYYSSIGFREYASYTTPFELAFAAPTGKSLPEELPRLLMAVNYFGKRGGFVQVMDVPHEAAHLDERFTELTTDISTGSFHPESTLQMLDDCSTDLSFAKANVYGTERVTLGKERVLRHVVLPYRLARWSRGYSWYQRITQRGEEEE